MLYIFVGLWLLALTYTVYKRDCQLKEVIQRLNQYLYEQENQQRKEAEKAEEESSDGGSVAT
jgi:hypothetical protein